MFPIDGLRDGSIGSAVLDDECAGAGQSVTRELGRVDGGQEGDDAAVDDVGGQDVAAVKLLESGCGWRRVALAVRSVER